MKSFLAVFLFFGLVACNNHAPRVNYNNFVVDNNLQEISRVQQFRFTGWQPLDKSYMVLLGTHNKAYLLKLMSPCNDLPFAHQIALKQTTSTTLVAKFDKVLVQNQMPDSSTIDKIYPLSKEQHKALSEYSGGSIKASKQVE